MQRELMGVRRAYSDLPWGQLHYREAGEPGNPTLLLLHQSPSHSAMYEPLMTALAGDFHLLAPDTPGFGGSDAMRQDVPNIAAYAAVIGDWLDLLGNRPPFIFGHHTGAAIAVQLEHDRPGSLALALSGPPLLDEKLKQRLPGLAEPFEADGKGTHVEQMWRRIRAKDEEAPLALTLRETLSALESGGHYQASYRAVAEQAFAELLPTIHCPTLVFAGDEDSLYHSVAPTLGLLPAGERAELTGGEGTYVCERHVEQIATLLADFFQHHRGSPDGRPGA